MQGSFSIPSQKGVFCVETLPKQWVGLAACLIRIQRLFVRTSRLVESRNSGEVRCYWQGVTLVPHQIDKEGWKSVVFLCVRLQHISLENSRELLRQNESSDGKLGDRPTSTENRFHGQDDNRVQQRVEINNKEAPRSCHGKSKT